MTRRAYIVLSSVFILGAGLLFTRVYGAFGYGGEDEGFIIALAYRLTEGQLPYRDFIYIRPPGSLLIHALPQLVLPAGIVVFVEKLLFYVFIATYSMIATAILNRDGALDRLGLHPLLFSLLSFVYSVQSFPPKPWHTVDGILLGTVALWCVIATSGGGGLVAGGLLLCLSAACKQSFYFLIPAVWLFVGLQRGRRDLLVVVGSTLVFAAAGAAALAGFGVLDDFVAQTTGQTRLSSLLYSGAIAYVHGLTVPAVAAIAVVAVVALLLRRKAAVLAVTPYVLFGLLGVAIILRYMNNPTFQTPAFNHPGLLFVAAAALVAIDLLRNRERDWTLAAMLALAWCAGLSWGYPTPVLFAAPILFACLCGATRWLGSSPPRLAAFVLTISVFVQWVGYQFPYREAPRPELAYQLGKVFPRLQGIYASERSRDRLAELRDMVERHDGEFAVLPGMPLAHFLTARRPVLELDWAMNNEAGFDTERLVHTLEQEVNVAFVEKDSRSACAGGPVCSDVTDHVLRTWHRVETGEFLDVYIPRWIDSAPTLVE
ncbi:MAG: hypothetical protein GY716_06130 [bacterium]|nr:hypothetical protein [bacterium]